MTTQEPYKSVLFVFYPEDEARLEEIARRMAAVLGLRRTNRSDALRRVIESFDIEAWEERNRPATQSAA